MSPISITLIKILNYCSWSIGGLFIKVAQPMGSTICVENIDLISS